LPVGVAIAAIVLVVVAPLLIAFGLAVSAVYFLLAAPPAPDGPNALHVEVAEVPQPEAAPIVPPVEVAKVPQPKGAVADPGQAAAAAGWVPLFREKKLEGWKGLARYWRVENQQLIGSSLPDGVDFNTFLVSERRYRDFELKFEVMVDGAKPNSGVQIRSRLVDPDRCIVVGPQCDIGETHWGDLFQEGPGSNTLRRAAPGVLDKIRPGHYNSYHIRCVGPRVTITVNGFVTVDEDFPDLPADGFIAWQIHRGAMQVVFRDVWLKNLDPP
jgi:hypothetical protein